MINNGIQSYRKTNVITADPGKLVLMCYEGAIDNLKLAKQHFLEKDYEGKSRAVKKTLDIIDELLCALDFENGGAIASNLEALYNFMTRRILEAETNQDISAYDEIIGILSELFSAWQEILARQEPKMPPTQRIPLDDQSTPVSKNYAPL